MLKISIKNTKFVTQRLCQSRLLPIRPISILYSLLPGSRWTPFLPRESVVSALGKPATNHHKIDQETIRIKFQIEMLQKQVTINIANCNTTVICITFIVKGVLWKDYPLSRADQGHSVESRKEIKWKYLDILIVVSGRSDWLIWDH